MIFSHDFLNQFDSPLHDEHVIYYLSRSLMNIETKYMHVDKLALESVQYVQHFSSLYLIVQNHNHFRLQPYATHPYLTIVGGEILQMDNDSPGV